MAAAKSPKSKLVWNELAVAAYERSKEKLFSPVLLAYPKPKAKLSLTTDASDIAIGAVLAQEDGRPLGFFSRKLSAAQQKYSAFDKELLGIKEAIKHFRHMVEGRQFVVSHFGHAHRYIPDAEAGTAFVVYFGVHYRHPPCQRR